MADVHVYMAHENLNMTPAQWEQYKTSLKALGVSQDPPINPGKLNHWRERLDGDAIIFEAEFDEVNVDIPAVKNYIGNEMGVDPATIDHATQATAYGRMLIFSRGGTNYVRMLGFGYDGGWPSWSNSGDAARAFLIANSAEWEPAA